MIAAHAMYASPRRCRGRAKIHTLERSAVKHSCGPKDKLAQNVCAARNVSPNKIGVVLLQVPRIKRMARQNAFAKSWREALNLSLDCLSHVDSGRVRHVTIGPGRMLTLGCTAGIKQAGLGY